MDQNVKSKKHERMVGLIGSVRPRMINHPTLNYLSKSALSLSCHATPIIPRKPLKSAAQENGFIPKTIIGLHFNHTLHHGNIHIAALHISNIHYPTHEEIFYHYIVDACDTWVKLVAKLTDSEANDTLTGQFGKVSVYTSLETVFKGKDHRLNWCSTWPLVYMAQSV